MNKIFIYEYINRLRKEDIIRFCNMRGIIIDNHELDIIYSYIKNDYKRFFINPMEVLYEIKNKVSDNTFNEIMKLYNQYKDLISKLK